MTEVGDFALSTCDGRVLPSFCSGLAMVSRYPFIEVRRRNKEPLFLKTTSWYLETVSGILISRGHTEARRGILGQKGSRYVTLWQGEGYSILKYKYYDRKSTDSHRWIFCCWFICYSYMRCWQWLLECLLQNKPSQGETQVHISWDTFTSDFRSLSAGWARPLRTSQSSAETLTRILVTMRLPTQTSRGSWSVQC